MKYLRRAILILSMLSPTYAASEPDASAQDDLETLMAEGERHARAGDLEAALRAYETALDNSPQSTEIQLKLAGMQVLNGKYRDSIANFQQVISQDPNNTHAFVGMGIAYLHLGDYSLARAALLEASKRDEKKRKELQKVLDWIETRAGKDAAPKQFDKSGFE